MGLPGPLRPPDFHLMVLPLAVLDVVAGFDLENLDLVMSENDGSLIPESSVLYEAPMF